MPSNVAWGCNDFGQCATNTIGFKSAANSIGSIAAVKEDGTIAVWGDYKNVVGEIPVGLSDVKQVAIIDNAGIALKSNGTVVSWSSGDYLGVEFSIGSDISNVPKGLTSVVAISAAGMYGGYALALKNDGTVTAWGEKLTYDSCTKVPQDLADVVQISAGMKHVLALKRDGAEISVGGSAQSGANFTVIRRDGSIVSWGSSAVSAPIQNRLSTLKLDQTTLKMQVGETVKLNAAAVADGLADNRVVWRVMNYSNTIQVAANGEVTAVGKGTSRVRATSVLDGNIFAECDVIVDQASITNKKYSKISLGDRHMAALKEDGTVDCWGHNRREALSIPTDLEKAVDVQTGSDLTVILTEKGTIDGWGAIDREYLKKQTMVKAISVYEHTISLLKQDGTVIIFNNAGELMPPAGLAGVVQTAAGRYHVLALKNDGTVVAWGRNSYGETSVPTGLRDVRQIAAGCEISAALKNDGSIVVWGNNSNNLCTVPVGAAGAIEISVGFSNIAVRKADGSIFSWVDFAEEINKPRVGFERVSAISNGSGGVAVITADGRAAAWGPYNTYGQLNVPEYIPFKLEDYFNSSGNGGVEELYKLVGVSDGGAYDRNIQINFEKGTAVLDGKQISSGYIEALDGWHRLVLTGQNGKKLRISFDILKPNKVTTPEQTHSPGGIGGNGGVVTPANPVLPNIPIPTPTSVPDAKNPYVYGFIWKI